MVTQSNLVAFIIGAGSHIGGAAAAQLHANGYKVALGNRSGGGSAAPEHLLEHDVEDPYFHVKIDVSRRETIDSAFDDVVAKLGPINVVIYNGLSFRSAFIVETGQSHLVKYSCFLGCSTDHERYTITECQ